MENNVIDFEKLSRIKVAGVDETITNQDARKIYVADDEKEYKRTSDFMLGNDDKKLDDGVYISVDEFVSELDAMLQRKENIEKIVMKKTGKKIKPENIEEIIKNAKKAGTITLKKNQKIINQEAKMVAVKTPNMVKEANVAGMMLGKNGMSLSDGDYVKQEDLEFTVVDKKVVTVPKINSKIKGAVKGLSTIAVSAGMIALIPWIMHANSVAWHHVGPELQGILHQINLGLGNLIKASYAPNMDGLWESFRGVAMNSDAATSSLATMFATYGLTAAGLAKITNDIKNGILKIVGKTEQKNQPEESLGGVSR